MTKALNWTAKNTKWLLLASIATAVAFPHLFTGAYLIRIATTSLLYVTLALGLNIVTGYMGQTSFGTAAFWGIGAYTAAIMSTRFGLGSGLGFVLAIVLAGLVSLLLGACVLKLKGYYMTIVTLGFCEIIRLVELNWMSLTRGPLGIMNIPKLSFFGIRLTSNVAIYYVILAIVVVVTYVVHRLMNSRFGLAITSIRDDEIATASMGINVVRQKIYAFVIYGMICGLAGAFYAHFMSYIDPTMFRTTASTEIVIMVIFGGLGSIPGTFLGAIVLTVLSEALRDLMEYRMLIYGLLLVFMMIAKPEGLLGSINFRHIHQRLLSRATAPEASHPEGGDTRA